MNLHWIDWTIIITLLLTLIVLATYTKRYMKSVADFLAANRLAGRYMMAVSGGFGGAISLIAIWEMLYANGFPTQWWSMIGIPVGLLISLSGFVIYRFRQTRALTLAQFFEMRYSRQFRYFSAILCWLSGIFNYGIFPAVTARFIMYFFGFPEYLITVGGHQFDLTFPLIMLTYLSIAVYIAWTGGQISIMITDFFQGTLLLIIFLTLLCFLMMKFEWADIIAGLSMAPQNQSMINPFKTSAAENFNVWYFLIGVFGTIYGTRAWQGASGYQSAAKTPHEAQMAGVIGAWRTLASGLCMLLIPLAAYAVMHLPKFASIATPIKAHIAMIADPQIQSQMAVPLFLSSVLPVGLTGLFAAIIVACAISCDDTYIHSWGSILIQDIVMPIRNKPLDQKRHLLLLRLSILGIAIFGFTFSLLFPLKDYILMFFALTGAIYLGGAGAVILGGLYWKRGTTAAAFTALSVGTVLAFGGMIVQQTWGDHPLRLLPSFPGIAAMILNIFPDWEWLLTHKAKFPVSSQIIYFVAMITAFSSYVLVSLLGPKQVFDMDKMLHRGKYAVKTDQAEAEDAIKPKKKTFGEVLGITTEFTRVERIMFWATFWWSMGWWGIFAVGTILNLFFSVSDNAWSWFWWFKVWVSFVLGIFCTVWFLCGGLRDAYRLLRDLKAQRVDEHDDGTVRKEDAASYVDK